jgi:hypothetical protein
MGMEMEYIQDNENIIWRVNYFEGYAEHFPASYRDLEPIPESGMIEYDGKMYDYLRKMGAVDIKYISALDKWNFKPFKL